MRAPEAVHGDGGGGAHVVHQAQAVSHLVADDILQGIAQFFLGQVQGAHAFIGLGGLDKHPLGYQADDVVVHIDRGVDNLTGAGIHPGGPHGVLDAHGFVADAVVFDVVGVEGRIFLGRGEIPRHHGVLEADAPERLAPGIHGRADVGLPPFRECGVDIKDDGFDGLHQLPAQPGGAVAGLHTPAVHQIHVLGGGADIGHSLAPGEEVADAGIGGAGLVGILRQQEERAGDQGRERLVVNYFPPGLVGCRKAVAARDRHRDIVVKGLRVRYVGILFLVFLVQFVGFVRGPAHKGREPFVVFQQEPGHVHHGAAVGAEGGDGKAPQNGPLAALGERIPVPQGIHVPLPELEFFPFPGKTHQEQVSFGAHQAGAVVADVLDRGPKKDFPPQYAVGNLKIHFVSLAVHGKEAMLAPGAFPQELLVCADRAVGLFLVGVRPGFQAQAQCQQQGGGYNQ